MNKSKEVNFIAILGVISNTALLIGKLIIGFISKSQAMIADGLNSAGDVFASLLTFIGNKMASQPEDEKHPFGHGKAEYIFSMIISFTLFLVAFTIIRNSFETIITNEPFNFSIWLIIISVSTIIIKIVLFFISRKIGRKHDSLLAIANAEDHRNDVFLTLGTLLSILFGYYGIYLIDGIVGILISLWIAYSGFQIFSQSFSVLMDTKIDPKIEENIKNTVMTVRGVDHIDSILSKPIGLNFILMVKVSVDASLTVIEGHIISANVKKELMKYDHIEDVIVHINPA